MSTVADLTRRELRSRLQGPGLTLAISPFVVRLHSPFNSLVDALTRLYADYALVADEDFADFHLSLERGSGLRRFFGREQSRFLFDGTVPFKPLPVAQAYPSFEWGLNWCVANHCHQFLILHAAVVERNGRAAILAAPPGSGKSTLCAGLVNRGWRLFSDELALIDTGTGELVAFPRPICLKNASIPVISSFAPDAELGPLVRETRKGNIAHVRPLRQHVAQAQIRAVPAWIVLPRFEAGVATRLRPMAKARAGWSLASNAFNFSVLGDTGFASLNRVVGASTAYELDYGDLDAATRLFAELADSR